MQDKTLILNNLEFTSTDYLGTSISYEEAWRCTNLFSKEFKKQGWRIPTVDEMLLLFTLCDLGVGAIAEDHAYWTSTEYQTYGLPPLVTHMQKKKYHYLVCPDGTTLRGLISSSEDAGDKQVIYRKKAYFRPVRFCDQKNDIG